MNHYYGVSVLKARKTDIVVIGSEAFTTAFKIIGIENVLEIKDTSRTQDLQRKIMDLVEKGIYSVFVVEETYIHLVQDIINELRYSVFPIFISLPGPNQIKIHDPKSYYLNKIKGVLGVSIEI